MGRNIIIGPMLVVAMAGAVSCLAAGAEGCGSSQVRATESKGAGTRVERLVKRLVLDLSLTAEQREQVTGILSDTETRERELKSRLAEAGRASREAARSPEFDEAAFRKLAAREGELRTELQVLRPRSRSRVMALLTPQQRAVAASLHSPPHGFASGIGQGRPLPPPEPPPGFPAAPEFGGEDAPW
jgi:Spy/CpxP family protein refolding chaperone